PKLFIEDLRMIRLFYAKYPPEAFLYTAKRFSSSRNPMSMESRNPIEEGKSSPTEKPKSYL
ncbi:MAG: hypothetical protein ACQERH_11250, partial [Acidobacteriota bacterium]